MDAPDSHALPGQLVVDAGAASPRRSSPASWSEPIVPDPLVVPQAAARIARHAHRTPILTSRGLDEIAGAWLVFKCENFQRVGAFKFRGAINALLQLDEPTRRRGVITHSSGNHAQALALAGKLTGTRVVVVMPHTAPQVKRTATLAQGAEVVDCEPTQQSREQTVAALIERYGYELIHPYDDWRVVAGQGTAAWELFEQAGPEPLDAVVAPVGGGGLLAGTALAALAYTSTTSQSQPIRIFGAEPACADDAKRSLELGQIQPSLNPKTLADGLRTALGVRPFAVLRRHVTSIGLVSEHEMIDAMRLVWERLKIVIEPSCAVPLAAILNSALPVQGQRVGIILSGGNVDLGPFFQALASKIDSV